MAWRDSLLDCSFRGVVFDVIGTQDVMGRAVSVAEYPYQDGGDTEDLGGRPVQFDLQAVFFGDDYELRLKDFLETINTPGPGELIHPIWGSIPQAQALVTRISHNAPEPDACTVAVEFMEGSPDRPFFENAGAVQVAETVGAAGDEAVDEAVEDVSDTVEEVAATNPLAALEELRQDMLGPLLELTAEAQSIAAAALDVLTYPRAWARDIATLANGILSLARFGDNLMQDWRAIISVFTRIRDKFSFGKSRSSSTPRPGTAPTVAQARVVVSAYLAVVSATAHADAAAMVLAAEARTATLSPRDIETVINAARAEIDLAIEAIRAALPLEQSRAITEPLKTQALALQEAAQAIIEARPPLVVRTLEAPGNLRLIAHLWYGDHTRALELLRLNIVPSPNALQAGDTLNAYVR